MRYEVSVVIPVFQDQAGLNRCLAAIELQDGIALSALEVIVVDNGSEPAMAVPKNLRFPTRLLWCSKKGAYAARNAGAKVATGRVLAFLDADCWPDSNWIRAGLRALTTHEGRGIIGGDVTFERSSRPTAVESYQVLMGFGQERSVKELKFSATANLFVARSVFDRVGPFEEALLSGGDREWSWRAAKLGVPVCYSAEAIVVTKPRTTLKGALIQARRVAGGRRVLENDAQIVANVGVGRIQPKKGLMRKLSVILSANQFSIGQRLKIFFVAMIIRLVHDFERVRISLGAEPERR